MYISRENLEEFGFTARCLGCTSLLRGTARQAHTENCRRRVEAELKGTAKADAAMRRIREYQDRAAAKGTKRTKTSQEEGHQQHEPEKPTARMEEDAPASSSSGNGKRGASAELSQWQHNEMASTMQRKLHDPDCWRSDQEGGDSGKEATKKRKAEEEHSEDPERDDGKWMRAEGNKREA